MPVLVRRERRLADQAGLGVGDRVARNGLLAARVLESVDDVNGPVANAYDERQGAISGTVRRIIAAQGLDGRLAERAVLGVGEAAGGLLLGVAGDDAGEGSPRKRNWTGHRP